jgi:hypothetical protein
MGAIAEETTTLPEGATVSITRFDHATQRGRSEFTQLRAWHDNELIKMRVDNISPQNMRQYLHLVIRQIERERAELTEAPVLIIRRPESIKDFVHNMAVKKMFIFNAIE